MTLDVLKFFEDFNLKCFKLVFLFLGILFVLKIYSSFTQTTPNAEDVSLGAFVYPHSE